VDEVVTICAVEGKFRPGMIVATGIGGVVFV
jgi:hypothetical protein